MNLFLSPLFLAPYLWLLLLIASVAWAVLKLLWLVRAGNTPWSLLTGLLAPVATFGVLSSPLWIFSLVDEALCRHAGLAIHQPVDGPATSIYWESHSPGPQSYSPGGMHVSASHSRETWGQIVRALVERRLHFVEIPYEPRHRAAQADLLHQKISLAWASSSEVACMANPGVPASMLPQGTCLAYETSQGIRSRYVLRGNAFLSEAGRSASIVERQSGAKVASYGYVLTTQGETMLARFGLKRLASPSCSADRTRPELISALVPLVFGTEHVARVGAADYANFRNSAWAPQMPAHDLDPVPKGIAGIDYWIAKGSLRRIGSHETGLWIQAKGKTYEGHPVTVPTDAFLVLGPMRLPQDLPDASWIIPAGQEIPPGPRSGSTFYGMGRGCLWKPFGCDHP